MKHKPKAFTISVKVARPTASAKSWSAMACVGKKTDFKQYERRCALGSGTSRGDAIGLALAELAMKLRSRSKKTGLFNKYR